jgi:squalene-hopene/tetraprenyl-beta-curcumene cyclase
MNAAVEAVVGETNADSAQAPLGSQTLKRLDRVIADCVAGLKTLQQSDGHWVFELEADATIPSEYVLLHHFLGEVDDGIERKIGVYLREVQGAHGGWPLFHDGDFDMSASVKAYYALKIVGDDIDAPHMKRARDAILERGGAATSNVFTRIMLALYGQVPWRAIPVMPVEIFHLPRWFPFHLSKVSYWSRTVIAPLLILMAMKPTAANPRKVDIRELFSVPPEDVGRYLHNPTGSRWGDILLWVDSMLRLAEPFFPRAPRRKAIDKAMSFVTERLNGENGLGAIYPAMANTVMAMTVLGYPKDHPDLVMAKEAIEKLLVLDEEKAYCQPCVSPIWDTALVAQAMLEAGADGDDPSIRKAMDWLADKQVLDVYGDWADNRPGVRPGGWPFQYANDHYPDVDDTAAVAIAMHRAAPSAYTENLSRAEEWVVGMQSSNGGWGAFDAENTHYHLNHIPFADHGALLDPPTSDVSARCIGMLAQFGYDRDNPVIRTGIDFLRTEQEEDGSWYGRWGTNYIYGTWSVLCALNAAGENMSSDYIGKAVGFLKARQRADGGWGDDGASYWNETRDMAKESTPSQTAWAMLGLMAAGEVESEAVRRGVDYLLNAPRNGVRWQEKLYTAVGFPRVFYLKYHGYSAFFPAWALARYRRLMQGNSKTVPFGM